MRAIVAGVVLAVACASPAGAVVLMAAGDVAQCGRHRPQDTPAATTGRLVPPDAYVAMLGDAAYPVADAATLAACYVPTWGRFLGRTYAVPGNHDGARNQGRDFYDYFGRRAPDPRHYRALIGDWWFFGLDSNGDAAATAAQLDWLKRELDLVRGDGRCIVAAWHHPLYSTGLHAGDGDRMRPAWEALADAGADIVLNGHEHYYESFRPKDRNGTDRPQGLREFVVGTGGAALADTSLTPWQHRAYARRHGLLELQLESGHYRWQFRSTDGGVLDAGEAACNRAPQSR